MKPNEVSERDALHTMRIIAVLAVVLVIGLCAAASLIAAVLH